MIDYQIYNYKPGMWIDFSSFQDDFGIHHKNYLNLKIHKMALQYLQLVDKILLIR